MTHLTDSAKLHVFKVLPANGQVITKLKFETPLTKSSASC